MRKSSYPKGAFNDGLKEQRKLAHRLLHEELLEQGPQVRHLYPFQRTKGKEK